MVKLGPSPFWKYLVLNVYIFPLTQTVTNHFSLVLPQPSATEDAHLAMNRLPVRTHCVSDSSLLQTIPYNLKSETAQRKRGILLCQVDVWSSVDSPTHLESIIYLFI